MVGMAVGDSVGAPLEFLPVGKKGSRFDSRSLKVIGEYNKSDSRRIKVKFDGNEGPINVFLNEIALETEVGQDGQKAKGSKDTLAVGGRCEAFYEGEWFAGTI